MRNITLVLALVLALLAACDERCRWTRDNAVALDATWSADGVAVPVIAAHASTYVFGDSELIHHDVTVELAQQQFTLRIRLRMLVEGRTALDASNAEVVSYEGSKVVFREPATGHVDLQPRSAKRCEGSGSTASCAIDIDGALDVEIGTGPVYRMTATFSVEQDLIESCAECPGFEGCDY
ncbi:MAG: hypothetical protein H0T89_26570 [Deltaproteobacteria bacterium]|nr:hypothetical protein [Deltaproteobacteria bacterium]MDQ3301604.1 hypothetical protein [Myxococcota bacterium]